MMKKKQEEKMTTTTKKKKKIDHAASLCALNMQNNVLLD